MNAPLVITVAPVAEPTGPKIALPTEAELREREAQQSAMLDSIQAKLERLRASGRLTPDIERQAGIVATDARVLIMIPDCTPEFRAGANRHVEELAGMLSNPTQ